MVTWTVTDDSGNTTTATQKVTVSDNTNPIITTGNDVEATHETGLCEVGLSITPATATDNCNVGSPVGTRDDGRGLDEPFPVGTTLISWKVQDVNGNSAEEVIQAVIVEDNEPPALPELEDIIWGCEYTVEAPTAIDNCSGEVTATTTDPHTYSEEGTYTINWNFEDEHGNISTTSQTISIQPIKVETSKLNVLCNGLATGEVEASATGGVAPLTYDWGSLGTGAKKTDLPAGTYTVTVSDVNGCMSAPIEVIVDEPDTFVDITGVQTTAGCYQQNNGTATVSVQGGVGNYTYLWDGVEGDSTVGDLSPGNHSVTVTDGNGCSKDRTFTVSQPAELKVTGFLTTETTSFGSATGSATAQLTGGTPNYSFEWSGPNGETYTGQTIRDVPAGTYSLIVTDKNGCNNSNIDGEPVTVEIVDSIEANILPTSVCEDSEDIIRTSYFEVDETTLRGGTAPYTFEWEFEGDGSISTATGIGSHKVTYETIGDKKISVTITDDNGLTFTTTIIQYVGGCFSNDCGSNDLQADDYFVGDTTGTPITSSNCNTTGTKYIYVNIPTNPDRYSLNMELIWSIEDIETGEVENFKEIGCFYEKEAIPDVAQTFEIDYECGDIVKIEGIYFTFSNKKKDECGEGNKPKCYSTNNEATVSSPLFAVAFANELLCNGASNGTVTFRASGGSGNYLLELLDSDGAVVPASPTNGVFNELSAGKYRVKVTDSDSGEIYITKEVEITQPSNPLQVNIDSQTNVSCFGGTDGSATLLAQGGTPDYIYVWPDGQTGPTATNLATGEYEVSILDANGCEIFTTVTIEQPAELIANAGPDQVLGCGFSSTQLDAEENLDENENPVSGTWSIVNGPAGGSFVDATDPKTIFSGNQGTYTLRWSVDCGESDDVKISFTSCSTLDFDGVDDHVNLGDNYGFSSGAFTVEAWIKPKSINGTRTILSKMDVNDASSGFELILVNGVPKVNGIGVSSFTSENVETNRWYHIAVTFDGATAKLYVDGLLLGTENASNPKSTTAPFLLGAIYDSTAPNSPRNLFHGWIEELRIWKKALSQSNIQFMMNQRLKLISNPGSDDPVDGAVIPHRNTDSYTQDASNYNLDSQGKRWYNQKWSDLMGYYQLLVSEVSNGITVDKAIYKVDGRLINITTSQKNTAPLPYVSAKNGSWWNRSSWAEPEVWDTPNSTGINDEKIDWNIAITSHTLQSSLNNQNKDISLLGLISKNGEAGKINMEGSVSLETGKELFISHYLQLDGVIDLNGESQLVQPEGSIVAEVSSGYLDRDQQGTKNSFNYNYWTSPVSLIGNANNSGFIIEEILKDGSNPANPQAISFNYQYHWADGNYSGNTRISKYWLYVFHGEANNYFDWQQLEDNELLNPGIGYSMKGTRGYVPVTNKQNYSFRGKPNNGDISVAVGKDQNLLTGNPYPSAIDSEQFIQDNLGSFNGSIYFWDHFGPENSHYLEEYVGGYAVYNLSGGVSSATSIDSRINANNDTSTKSPPGKYIPVAQAFFVNTKGVTNPTTITYKNKYRAFVPESSSSSQFHAQEDLNPKKGQESNGFKKDTRYKIRLKFESPKGYHRQLLVAADASTTNGFDLGYDAPLIENNVEDMYWLIDDTEFVIQAVPDFNLNQVLPLGIKISEIGDYTIKIDEVENIDAGFDIYLKDLRTDEYFNITKEAYKATAEETGFFNERYQIVFRKELVEKPTEEKPEIVLDDSLLGLQYLKESDEISLFNPDLMNVDFVELYSISGQKIKTFKDVPSEESILLRINQKLSSAVYIVKVYSGEKVISKKVIITK